MTTTAIKRRLQALEAAQVTAPAYNSGELCTEIANLIEKARRGPPAPCGDKPDPAWLEPADHGLNKIILTLWKRAKAAEQARLSAGGDR